MNKNLFAPVPPMGWNSWDCYGASVNEEQLLSNARYMANNLKDYGWQYIVCDIQWSEPKTVYQAYSPFTDLCMDEFSRLIPAENRFPSSKGGKGFKPIADKIHAMGLKFGIHIMRGIPRQAVHRNTAIKGTDITARQIAKTYSICPWNTDMYGIDCSKEGAQAYYDSIFELYAQWEVDFVKVDDICASNFDKAKPYHAPDEVEAIHKAIEKCGRPIVLSLSPGPAVVEEAFHLSQNANMWRITDDFWDEWRLLLDMFSRCRKWYTHVRLGCWPDCDMLPLGQIALFDKNPDGTRGRKTRFTKPEQITMMTLWSIFRSPLIMGGDLNGNDDFTLSLLTNREIIEINQFSSGGHPVIDNDDFKLWACICSDGSTAVAVFNVKDEPAEREIDLSLLGIVKAKARALWNHCDLGEVTDKLVVTLEPHGAAMIKFSE
ncbi:MAG: glycoside hydrolase family 27 protein [Clostridiales bacterium]|nr:glycoside hydrolase family 27 protein [Clostridiales bacterium]